VVIPEAERESLLQTLASERVPVASIRSEDLPEHPGLYVWYQDGAAVFVSNTSNLRNRVYVEHVARSGQAISSALRRLAARTLGIASNADLRSRKHVLSESESHAVETWIRQGDVSWMQTDTETEAVTLASSLQGVILPPGP
jgi:hypothetical protein